MNRFFRNKKGEMNWILISLLIAVAVAAIIIIITNTNILSFGKTIESASKCSGFISGQSTPAQCLPSSECGGQFLSYGCENSPGTVCCFVSKQSQSQTLASCNNNWNVCSKCKVKLTGMELRPYPTNLNKDFRVVCKTSVQDAPCVDVKITDDKNSDVGSCNYVKGQTTHTIERVFVCPGNYFIDAAKTYTLTCVLRDAEKNGLKACCIDEPSVEGNAKRSVSIKLAAAQ